MANQEGPIEIQLAASRDLLHWERHFRMPCIAMSTPGAWDSGIFYTQARAIRVGDEIWVYYGGSNYTHGFPTRYRALGMKGRATTAAIGLAKWKLDRGESHAAAKFRGKPVSLRFRMKNAELYSFAFRRD